MSLNWAGHAGDTVDPRELKQTQRKTEIMLSQFFWWLKNKTRLHLAFICWKQQCYKMHIIFCEKYEVLQQNRHFWNQHPKLFFGFIQQIWCISQVGWLKKKCIGSSKVYFSLIIAIHASNPPPNLSFLLVSTKQLWVFTDGDMPCETPAPSLLSYMKSIVHSGLTTVETAPMSLLLSV